MAIGDWLAHTRATDDPAGDLIRDMRDDPRLPRDVASMEALRGYLQSRGACPEAVKAARTVMRRYRNWQDRHPVYPSA
jgi:YozE SAM-like fold